MRSSLSSLLACPSCREPFEFEGNTSGDRLGKGVLSCTNKHLYQVKDEIPILKDPKLSEKEFTWKVEFPNVEEYDRIRKEYASYFPEELRAADKALLDEIVKNVLKETLILDVASGMGGLLLALSKEFSKDRHVIGTDVDEKPLRGAKLKLEEQKSYGPVSLCVMDGKHLALKQLIVPCISSFFGFDNIPKTKKAFQEACRVLKPHGRLVFASLWLEEGSRSLIKAEELGFGAIATENKLVKVLEDTGFKVDSVETFHSGRWPFNPMDLLPYEGDWFAHSLVEAHKK